MLWLMLRVVGGLIMGMVLLPNAFSFDGDLLHCEGDMEPKQKERKQPQHARRSNLPIMDSGVECGAQNSKIDQAKKNQHTPVLGWQFPQL